MKRRLTIADRYYRARSRYWRLKRLLFPSPAEVRFLELMGAKLYRVSWLHDPNTLFPATIVLSRGRILRRHKLKREVRYGKYYVDFANDIHWVIEIDGTPYHQDVVADFDREVYIRELLRRDRQELRIIRIPAPRLWHDRDRVQRDVVAWLNR